MHLTKLHVRRGKTGEAFQNTVVIVTGGGMGLGQALCEELARHGAKVVIADIDGDAASQVAERLQQSGLQADAVHVDVANEADVARLVERTVAAYGHLDYLFNNAGIATGGDARDLVPRSEVARHVDGRHGPQVRPGRGGADRAEPDTTREKPPHDLHRLPPS